MSTKTNQETAETNFQTGKQLAGEGKLDEAIAIYRQAIELNPNNSEFHRSLGEVLQRVGQHEEAIASYRQTIELQPKFSEAYHNLEMPWANSNNGQKRSRLIVRRSNLILIFLLLAIV